MRVSAMVNKGEDIEARRQAGSPVSSTRILGGRLVGRLSVSFEQYRNSGFGNLLT